MIAQYKAQRPTSPERIVTGLWLVGWGIFKKMCIADLASPFVNAVYANPGSFNGSYTSLATFLFALQIYCDFSGYSDIAIGIARIMGFDLMINFRQPYFAASLTDFWRRWHISLSTWFRDYLYVPLGGIEQRDHCGSATRSLFSASAEFGTAPAGHFCFGVFGTALHSCLRTSFGGTRGDASAPSV